MIWLRKILFYVLCGVYFIVCPLVIFNAFGYFYHPHSAKGIVKTGLIYLSSIPRGARVYIENRRVRHKTPVFLRDLLEGQYPIQIAKKGYKPWLETLPVEAGKATVMDRVLLLPEKLQSKVIIDEAFEHLIPMEGTRFIILAKGEKLEDYHVYDFLTHRVWPLSTSEMFGSAVVVSHVQSENSTLLLFKVKLEGDIYLLFDVSRKKNNMKNLTSAIHSNPTYTAWDAHNEQYLFTFQSGTLDFIPLASQDLQTQYFKNILGFGLQKGKIILLGQDGSLVRMDIDKKNEEILFSDPKLIMSLFDLNRFYSISILSKDLMLFLSDEGKLIANVLPYTLIESGLRGFQIHSDKGKVLVWSRKKIGIISFPIRNFENLFEEGPTVHWAYTQGRSLEQAFWVFDQSHLLFRDHNTISLLALDPLGAIEAQTLIDVQSNSSVYYSEATGCLYYLDIHSGQLCSIQILPKSEIISLTAQEPLELQKLLRLKINEF